MSLAKIVSDVSNERGIREKEQEGWDYYFRNPEDMLSDRAEGKYLQYIEFNDIEYGYQFSEFTDMDSLVIVCGGSGSGKDETFKYLMSMQNSGELFSGRRVKFLFSIPETVPLFVDFCAENGIGFLIIHLYVEEEERLKRVLLENNRVERACFTVGWEADNLEVKTTLYEVGENDLLDVARCIKDSKERVLRDRESPFELGIDILKEDKYPIHTLRIKGETISEVASMVHRLIQKGSYSFKEEQ